MKSKKKSTKTKSKVKNKQKAKVKVKNKKVENVIKEDKEYKEAYLYSEHLLLSDSTNQQKAESKKFKIGDKIIFLVDEPQEASLVKAGDMGIIVSVSYDNFTYKNANHDSSGFFSNYGADFDHEGKTFQRYVDQKVPDQVFHSSMDEEEKNDLKNHSANTKVDWFATLKKLFGFGRSK